MGKKGTQEWFLSRMVDIFGSRYCFDKSIYNGNRNDITYYCKACDEFYTKKAMFLLRGCGCRVCSRKTIARKKTSSTDEFISKAKSIHGDEYFYDKVVYVKNSIPVSILCPSHGEFLQAPSNHLNGQGCKECGNWDLLLSQRPNDPATLYNVLFIPDDGSKPFIKVGITTKDSWKDRFYGAKNLGYTVKKMQSFSGTVNECAKRERLILDYLSSNGDRFKTHNLKGTHLGGWTECYSIDAHDDVINMVFNMQ